MGRGKPFSVSGASGSAVTVPSTAPKALAAYKATPQELTAALAFCNGTYELSGVPRMHERPQAALFNALLLAYSRVPFVMATEQEYGEHLRRRRSARIGLAPANELADAETRSEDALDVVVEAGGPDLGVVEEPDDGALQPPKRHRQRHRVALGVESRIQHSQAHRILPVRSSW